MDDLLVQLHEDLAEAASALEEIQHAGLIQPAKFLEQTMNDLKAKIAALGEEK